MPSLHDERAQDTTDSARWRQAMLVVPMLALAAGLGAPMADPAAVPHAITDTANLLRAWGRNARRVMGGRTHGER